MCKGQAFRQKSHMDLDSCRILPGWIICIIFYKNYREGIQRHKIQIDVCIFFFEEGSDPEKDIRTETTE